MARHALAFCLAAMSALTAAAQYDPVQAKLDGAKARHAAVLVELRTALLDDFTRAEDAARAAGNKARVRQLQAERAAFADKGETPKTLPGQTYSQGVALARNALADAYRVASVEYLKAKKDAESDAVDAELNALLTPDKPAPAPAGPPAVGFECRAFAERQRLVAAGGGSDRSEAAVARGLEWLARKQRADGSWQFDGTSVDDRVAATGLALLPFLAAGHTHKPVRDNKYQRAVEAGLKFLLAAQTPTGTFKGSSGMYSHAIATLALCELFGMTYDRPRLMRPAQAAVNYIIKAQAENGSWGYTPNKNGDTSIVGWQVQALHAAKLCKDLVVPKNTFEKSRAFLDTVAGRQNATYGYTDRTPKLSLTPVGLLCRSYTEGWGPNTPGMAAGVKYVLDKQTPAAGVNYDMYFYYYATQVLHFFDGPEWHKQWNPAMRDMLLDKQGGPAVKEGGSWAPDESMMGGSTGRLGTTCLCLLTLEVYYRYPPPARRGAAAE